MNSLKKPSKNATSPEHYETGLIYSAGNGTTNTGF